MERVGFSRRHPREHFSPITLSYIHPMLRPPILALILSTSLLAQSSGAAAAHDYRVAHEQQILQEFTTLLAIPNVASDKPNIQLNADASRRRSSNVTSTHNNSQPLAPTRSSTAKSKRRARNTPSSSTPTTTDSP